jgi:hypothetical protein
MPARYATAADFCNPGYKFCSLKLRPETLTP